MKDYVQWIYHGEQSQMRDNDEAIDNEDENEEWINEENVSHNEIHDMLEEIGGKSQANQETTSSNNGCDNLSESEAKKFEKLLKEAECELYPGCKKFSKLSFVVKLLHLKVPFKGEYDAIPKKDFDMAQWYVLNNCEEAKPFLQEHKNELLNQDVVNIEEKHREHFSLWFKGKIMHLSNKENSMSIKKLYPLAMGPNIRGRRYPGCIVNGVRYHIQSRDELRKSQNSGTVVEGYHENEVIDFYGIIVDINELEYIEGNRVVLFKCKWFDLRKKTGMQKDKNFTSINVNRFWYEHDSFVLATQAKQVFYICDPKLGKNWRIVQKFQDRHIYDVLEMQNSKVESDELHTTDEVYQDVSMESNMIDVSIEDMPIQFHRDDVDSITLDSSAYEFKVQTEHEFGYNTEDSDLEDDSIIEYISDLDRTEGTTRAYLSLTTTSASLLLLPASIFDEVVQSSKQYLDVAFAPSKEEGHFGRGFEVTRLNTYTTAPVNHVDQYLLELALSAPVVAVASPSALRVWANLTASRQWDNAVECIGETTTSAAKKLGFRNIYYPTSPGLEGVYWEQSLYLHKVVVRLRAHHPPRPHLWEYTRYVVVTLKFDLLDAMRSHDAVLVLSGGGVDASLMLI
ncbi:hypothetical protein MTR67_013650 [Solanum verrucosum]|uniref:DUF4216 domain-containing protein n=1 Tax=Solanum verrucosum TaxID=315347 RepID=A0AAF0QFF0_SOLVR|nr:hypothetical protein MTR67_013650 [Solanum verrucosum]